MTNEELRLELAELRRLALDIAKGAFVKGPKESTKFYDAVYKAARRLEKKLGVNDDRRGA